MPSREALTEKAMNIQARLRELTQRFNTLASFEEAACFDTDALETIRIIEHCKIDLEASITLEQEELRKASEARNALPFFKRLFASREAERVHANKITTAHTAGTSLDNAVSDLYEMIDRTPNSKEEQKQMLAELRLMKKEIALQKRSINESMRDIRAQARKGMTLRSGFSGGMVRLERMQIRYAKEAALAPQETSRANLERQIIDIERRINWISRYQ